MPVYTNKSLLTKAELKVNTSYLWSEPSTPDIVYSVLLIVIFLLTRLCKSSNPSLASVDSFTILTWSNPCCVSSNGKILTETKSESVPDLIAVTVNLYSFVIAGWYGTLPAISPVAESKLVPSGKTLSVLSSFFLSSI